jgi:hypothetical protein
MPSAPKTAEPEKTPTQALLEANTAFATTFVEAGYKAQTRGLNVARVFIEAAGRQQENGRKLVEKLTDPALPPYSPERYTAFMNTLVENQNEALRIGREYIDELNAAAAEARQSVESLLSQAGKAREAQQALYTEGFRTAQEFAGTFGRPAEAARA